MEHPPGEAQADFGEVVFFEKGKKIKGHEFVLSFPYSNGSYVQLLKGENQECLLTGLKDIFEHIDRVPNVIWFDNLTAAVAGITTSYSMISLILTQSAGPLFCTVLFDGIYFLVFKEHHYFGPRRFSIFKILIMFFNMGMIEFKFIQYLFKLIICKIITNHWNYI